MGGGRKTLLENWVTLKLFDRGIRSSLSQKFTYMTHPAITIDYFAEITNIYHLTGNTMVRHLNIFCEEFVPIRLQSPIHHHIESIESFRTLYVNDVECAVT